jgi:endoglucanase
MKKHRKQHLIWFMGIGLLLSIGLTVYLGQQRQENRSRAAASNAVLFLGTGDVQQRVADIASGSATPSTASPSGLPQGETGMHFTLLLHGLGKGGDNSNASGGGTMNPGRNIRNVVAYLYNSQNMMVATRTGSVAFNESTGVFEGDVLIGPAAGSGNYMIKIKTDQFLRGTVPGTQLLTAGTNHNFPLTTLMTGDINNDNKFNLLDYNLLIGCYADVLQSTTCPEDQKFAADLNDDGAVGHIDYNLFLRELAKYPGDEIEPTIIPVSPTPTVGMSETPTASASATVAPSVTNAVTPTSAPSDGTPVGANGQLKVCGTKLCNKNNKAIQLRGMSTHGLQWHGACYNQASIQALAKDWKADVVRLSMYVQEDGYEKDPAGFTAKADAIIDQAIAQGMYVLIDWHILTPGDPNTNLEGAKTYFTHMAQKYGNKPNVMYEIANEPNGVSWASIKSYSEKIIPVIRAIDPDGVIVVGTRGFASLGMAEGSSAQEIIDNPVSGGNLMYNLHFYAASHGDDWRTKVAAAADKLPLFATEWGTQTYSGDGANDLTSSQKWLDLLKSKQISWTNWNYSDDFRSGAVFKEGTCPNGPWTGTTPLKESGIWVRDHIINPADSF